MTSRISGFENYARANFLYQAAISIYQTNSKLSQFYIHEMRQICEKVVIRM
jgi:RNase P subunit RPR2